MKKSKLLMLLMILITISSCDHKPIDKQEADNIVTQYVKKNYKSNDNTLRAVWYLNRLGEERIEISFAIEGEESITAENAYVYYIDENVDIGDVMPHTFKIMVVQKDNGKYTIHQRMWRPYIPTLSQLENYWTILFFFENNKSWAP